MAALNSKGSAANAHSKASICFVVVDWLIAVIVIIMMLILILLAWNRRGKKKT